jgi:hypothetical protein
MTTTKPTGWFSGRTKLITIASIVVVGASGAFAVGANIGILNAADNTEVGALSAAGDLTTPNTQVVDVYLDGTTTTATATVNDVAATAASAAAPQQFAVDTAGTVSLAATDTGLRLDSVTPATGWSWTLTQTQPTDLTVTLTNGVRTLEFAGSIAADGTIVGSVTEPIVTPAPSVTNAPASGGYDDEYEGGGDDD